MRKFTSFITLLLLMVFISSTITAQEMQRRAPNPDAKTATMSQERLNAIENGTTFTVPERGTDDVVDIHFIIEGDWAATIDASAWNIWSYTDAAYLWPVNTPIAAFEIQDVVVGLEGGQDYSVELFDPNFGDAGIGGDVSYNENGAPIVSWDFYDWSGVFGYFDFFVFDHLTMATSPSPADQEIDVTILGGGVPLSWTNGEGMEDMQILFGTEYPPTQIFSDWGNGLVQAVIVPVDYNLQYFWQINYTNPLGSLDGEVWGFTTEIMVPGDVTATQDANFEVRVEWTSSVVVPPANRALIGYNIFENGIEIATEVPGDSYVITNPTYDMSVETCYQVQAVFDEGISDLSACTPSSVIFVNGTAELNGNVTEAGSGDPLALAMIHATGTDNQGGVWEYDIESTIPFGYYEEDVVAGTYDFMVTLDQFEDLMVTGVAVPYGVTTTQDFVLTPWGPPVCADTPYPADTEQDINANNLTLTWNLDEVRTDEYRILFDTEYPPTDVLVDWTAAAESYALPGALDPNMQYFWQVQVRNSWGDVTNCDIWGFTTTITVPGDLTATVMDVDDVLLEWTSSEQQEREFIEYVVYRDAAEIARTTDTEYLDEDLAYNPTTCYSYQVEAIFDEGTSDMSDPAEACITGFGSVDGYVMDALPGNDPIEGATVMLDGMGELGETFTYTFTTDAFGYYEGDVMVGNYDYEVTAAGYLPAMLNDDVAYDTYTTNDFYLDEFPDPLAYVIATELNDDEAHLEWGFNLAAYVPTYFPIDTDGMTDAEIEMHMIDFLGTMGIENPELFTMDATAEGGERDIESYDVYRGLWDDDFGDMVYVGNTTQMQFIDYDWGAQPMGVYKWAVVVVYTVNDSDPTYSNYLDKDMETIVNIEVTLNSAENPSGTNVTLTNTSEPYLALSYNVTLGSSGMTTIDPIRKGDYNVLVTLWGYGTVTDAVTIEEETDLEYLLYEIIADPMDFYVNPNGFATWVGAIAPPVFSINESFDEGIPSSWTNVLYNGTTETWYGCDNCLTYVPPAPSDGICAAAGSSAGTGEPPIDVGLFTPAMDLSGETSVVLEYDRNFQDFAGAGQMAVRTYSGTMDNFEEELDFRNIDDNSSTIGHHTYMFDPSGYLDPGAVYVEFWYTNTDGTSGYGWSFTIDNVEINNGSKNSSRSLNSYKVWLDNVLSGEPTEEWWDYEANEALVEGQTYLAEVASVYTTGISNTVPYTFTYYPCTYFDGPTSVTADVVIGTMDALITWTPVASNVSGDDVVGVNVFRDGELIAMVPVGTSFYVDEQLDAADYEYCITNFYESEAQSCQVCDMVTITPGGYVNGFVTEFATGDPIEGAQVLMVAGGDPYFFTTDATGYYEGEVVAGTYDYVVSAEGYESQTLEDILIDFGVTVTQDFQLLHFPYPVGSVIATEINDNSVLVNWSGQGGGGGDEIYLDFEDGMPDGFLVSDDRLDAYDGNLTMDGTGATTYGSGYYDQMFGNFVFEFELSKPVGATSSTMGCLVRGDGFHGTGTQNGYAFAITANGSWWYAKYINGALTDWTGWLTSTAINIGNTASNIVSIEASGSTLMYFINGTLIHTVIDTEFTEGYCAVMAYDSDVCQVTWDYYSITPGAKAINYDVTEEIMTEKKGTIDNCIQAFDSPGKITKGVEYYVFNDLVTGGSRETYIFEDFQTQTAYTDVDIAGWVNEGTVGGRAWFAQSFSGNLYAQATSFNSDEVNEMYLITPAINLDEMDDPRLKFLSAQAYWNHDGLTVLISTDFDGSDIEGATWDELNCNLAGENDPNHAWVPSGIISLADYEGDAYIAFKYVGEDGIETTSYRLDDIEVYDGGAGIAGYNVYAGPCDGDAEDMVFKGFTLDQTFTDNTWGTADPGIYKWAVEVVYDYNTSAFAYSNCLDKDMITTVTVEVTTNSGDSPEGTDVVFTNVSEMADPPIVFETELDASGIYTWTDFRKGTYDIYVHLNGFADIMLSDVYIWDEAYFEWMLEELLAPPSDLYVTPLGYATWSAGGIVPFEPFLETFDEELPDTWTVIAGGSTGEADTWHWLTSDGGNTLDGTPFMFADSDAAGPGSTMDEIMISPVIENTENADALFVEFDYIYQYIGSEYFEVDVYDGDDWVNIFHSEADSGPFPWGPTIHEMIDVTEYANPDFQVRFHYVSNGWNWYVAVDNVAVTEGDSKYADRMVEYYKVWHESSFITDRDTTFYQYGDNGEVLVPYTTYHAEVATVFSTGISPKSEYYWTYIPCEDYPGPEQFYAENVPDTEDVLITWSATGFTPYSFNFDEGVPEGWTIEDGGTTEDTWFWTESDAGNTLDDTPFMMVDSDAAGSGSQSDELFISPVFDYTETADVLYIEFDQYYNNLSTTEWANVDVWDGTEWVTVLHQTTDVGSWTSPDHQMIDVTEHANPEFKVRFHYYAPGWYWYWAIDNFELNAGEDKDGDDDPLVGANLYRDGEMIAFVEVPDTSYLDEGLAPGYYDYCITYLYESGAHSCLGDVCVEDVLIGEECTAPQDLTAEVDGADPNLVHLLWDQGTGIAEWLFYDDGTNVDGIGGPAIFHWAIKFDPAQLTPYDGTSVTKISLYARTAPVNTLQIFEGTGAETLIHEQDLVGLTIEAWNEVELDSPVLIDVTKELWITVYTEDGANYPAGCGPTQNEPNGDLISQDGGATWDHLSDFSLPYTWNLRCYVEDAKGAQKPLALENDKVYNTTSATVAASGVVNTSENAVFNMTDASREWLGYNIYKDGELLEALWPDNFYDDTEYQLGDYCYTVTSEYSICGESDPSNEACIEIIIGVNELDATEANLYPNPARDQITIKAVDMTRLHIVNYVGQVIYDQEFDNSNSKQLNTQNYQSGVYVARIYTEKGVITKRFVINR